MPNDNNSSDGLIHVQSYTRDDGTQVDDYYRHYPDKGFYPQKFENECPNITKLFGGVSSMKQYAEAPVPVPPVILEGGVEVVKIVLDNVVKIGKIAGEVIAKALPIAAAMYETYQVAKSTYNSISNIFSTPELKVKKQKLNTSIQGLREVQKLQKKNVQVLSQKAVSAKNKEEYQNLIKQISNLNNQSQQNEKLLTKIEHSASIQDYKSVAEGLKEYSEKQESFIKDYASIQENYLPYKIENAYNNFGDNSAKAMTLDGQNESIKSFLPEDINEMFKLQAKKTYTKAKSNLLDYSKGSIKFDTQYSFLKGINNYLNRNNKDARELMNIALDSPQDITNTNEWTFISSELTSKVNETLGLTGNQQIPASWDGFVFGEDSSIAESIINSSEFKDFIKDVNKDLKKGKKLDNRYFFDFKSNQNINYSLGHATLLNPSVDNQGYFRAVIYDKYDYEYWENKPKITAKTRFYNNWAFRLQEWGIITNYYVIIPLKVKI